MTDAIWWNSSQRPSVSKPNGIYLSRKDVQAFVFPLPSLRKEELEASLRYKVQTLLPVQTESFAFQSHLFRHKGRNYGAAFLASPVVQGLSAVDAKELRLGFPLTIPDDWGSEVLLFVSSPEGLEVHVYEAGVLTSSFAPIKETDEALRQRILDRHSEARVMGIALDGHFPLPRDLTASSLSPAQTKRFVANLPLWNQPRQRAYPLVLAALFAVVGLLLLGNAAFHAAAVRQERNDRWSRWLKTIELAPDAASLKAQTAKLENLAGVPIPELFVHLAKVWPKGETIIQSLEWKASKLTLVAQSNSALTSLKQMDEDPWFRRVSVIEIRTQKDGSELFTIEGDVSRDP